MKFSCVHILTGILHSESRSQPFLGHPEATPILSHFFATNGVLRLRGPTWLKM